MVVRRLQIKIRLCPRQGNYLWVILIFWSLHLFFLFFWELLTKSTWFLFSFLQLRGEVQLRIFLHMTFNTSLLSLFIQIYAIDAFEVLPVGLFHFLIMQANAFRNMKTRVDIYVWVHMHMCVWQYSPCDCLWLARDDPNLCDLIWQLYHFTE